MLLLGTHSQQSIQFSAGATVLPSKVYKAMIISAMVERPTCKAGGA